MCASSKKINKKYLLKNKNIKMLDNIFTSYLLNCILKNYKNIYLKI